MSGTRFARNGRWRVILCGGAIILLLTMLAIFHNQQELDEKREQRLRSLNEQLQSIVEQKYHLEQSSEHERMEQMEARRNLEQKVKELNELFSKEQGDARLRYDTLEQSHKNLQTEHNALRKECDERKKQHLEDANEMKKTLQGAEQANNLLESELRVWREKYDTILKESKRLEVLLMANGSTKPSDRIIELERAIAEYKTHCDFEPQPKEASAPLSKPLHAPDITSLSAASHKGGGKSFGEQELVSPGQYRVNVKTAINQTDAQKPSVPSTNQPSSLTSGVGPIKATQNTLPSIGDGNNRGVILNSVENFQMIPNTLKKTSAESPAQIKEDIKPQNSKRLSSTAANKLEVLNAAQMPNKPSANTSTSSSSLSPLQLPPNSQRKLPENVAPIPAYFDDAANQKTVKPSGALKLPHDTADADTGDMETAGGETQRKNGRYGNVDLAAHAQKAKKDVDSGAHEIKDNDFANGDNFNVPPADEDGNFFDGIGMAGGSHKDDENANDILDAGADEGDIAVKGHNHLLDADNLNNEVEGDQGKEFPADGLHLDDGNDEDGDEDDYSNMAARQPGAQVIRN